MLSSVARNKRIAHSAKSSLTMVATAPRPTKEEKDSQVETRNFMEQISAAGIASAAVVAAAAVNQAVGKFSSFIISPNYLLTFVTLSTIQV